MILKHFSVDQLGRCEISHKGVNFENFDNDQI